MLNEVGTILISKKNNQLLATTLEASGSNSTRFFYDGNLYVILSCVDVRDYSYSSAPGIQAPESVFFMKLHDPSTREILDVILTATQLKKNFKEMKKASRASVKVI